MLRWPVARALARHPTLWPSALGALFAFAARGWWRRPPYLPRPDAGVVRWRVETAYGSGHSAIEPDDVVAYLRWRRAAAGGA